MGNGRSEGGKDKGGKIPIKNGRSEGGKNKGGKGGEGYFGGKS